MMVNYKICMVVSFIIFQILCIYFMVNQYPNKLFYGIFLLWVIYNVFMTIIFKKISKPIISHHPDS